MVSVWWITCSWYPSYQVAQSTMSRYWKMVSMSAMNNRWNSCFESVWSCIRSRKDCIP